MDGLVCVRVCLYAHLRVRYACVFLPMVTDHIIHHTKRVDVYGFKSIMSVRPVAVNL